MLDNARVRAVEQHGFDRIAVFRLERGADSSEMVIELFGRGNIIVVKDWTTVAALYPHTFKDRAVEGGEAYAFPAAGVDPLEHEREGFANAVRGAKSRVYVGSATR